MSVSVRSYLMAGVAAVGAVTIAVPSLHVAPPDIAVDSTYAPTAPTALTDAGVGSAARWSRSCRTRSDRACRLYGPTAWSSPGR